MANGQVGVPFNIIYGPEAPKGIILPVILKYADVQQILNKIDIVDLLPPPTR